MFAGVNGKSQCKINENVLVDILDEGFQSFGNFVRWVFNQRNNLVQKIQNYDSLFILNKSTKSCSIHVENLVGNLVGFFSVVRISRKSFQSLDTIFGHFEEVKLLFGVVLIGNNTAHKADKFLESLVGSDGTTNGVHDSH